MLTDPISDYLTRIRNAQMAKHKLVDIPYSNIKNEITRNLFENGYVHAYKTIEKDNFKNIRIALKYRRDNDKPVINKLKRISKPGLRKYTKSNDIPQVINGLGISILSTSKGIITDKQARENNVGGEILCEIH